MNYRKWEKSHKDYHMNNSYGMAFVIDDYTMANVRYQMEFKTEVFTAYRLTDTGRTISFSLKMEVKHRTYTSIETEKDIPLIDREAFKAIYVDMDKGFLEFLEYDRNK